MHIDKQVILDYLAEFNIIPASCEAQENATHGTVWDVHILTPRSEQTWAELVWDEYSLECARNSFIWQLRDTNTQPFPTQ